MTANPIKVAAIGLGWVTCNRHIPALQAHPDIELVGLIDTEKSKAQTLAHKLNVPHFGEASSLENIDWLYDVDAVTIGAPPSLHKDLALSALKQNKHVLVEKPFAMNIDEGEAMIMAAKKADKTLSIVHNFQFSKAAQKLQKDLANGKLGKIKSISASQLGNPKRRLPSWYEELPLGLFYDESPHFFYLLHDLTQGSLSFQKGYKIEDKKGKQTPQKIHALYKSVNDILVTIDCQFDCALSEWFIRVDGEKATGLIDIFRDIYIRLPNDQTHNAFNILRTSLSAFTQHFWQHIPNGIDLMRGSLDYGNNEIIRRFVTSIKTNKEDDKIGFTQALSILKLQHETISKVQGISI